MESGTRHNLCSSAVINFKKNYVKHFLVQNKNAQITVQILLQCLNLITLLNSALHVLKGKYYVI